MSYPTPLQGKIGGSARSVDRTAIIAGAERQLAAAAPQIELALQECRFNLRRATAGVDLEGVFAATHEIRGIAGTIGRPSIGKLADSLARYMTSSADAGLDCAALIVKLLAGAIDGAFDLQEGDDHLVEAVEVAAKLSAAFTPGSFRSEGS